MFAIDLLKGKGLPVKRSPRRMIARAVPFVVPLGLAALWAAGYRSDCALAASRQRAIAENQSVIEAQAKPVKAYQQVQQQTAALTGCLNDIQAGLAFRVQFSDLLAAFVATLPDAVFIEEVDLNRNPLLEKKKDEASGNVTQHLRIDRKLTLMLCRHESAGNDQLVWDYVDALKQSPVLAPVFTEFKMVSQQQGTADGKPVIFYEIECTLRKQGSL